MTRRGNHVVRLTWAETGPPCRDVVEMTKFNPPDIINPVLVSMFKANTGSVHTYESGLVSRADFPSRLRNNMPPKPDEAVSPREVSTRRWWCHSNSRRGLRRDFSGGHFPFHSKHRTMYLFCTVCPREAETPPQLRLEGAHEYPKRKKPQDPF